MKQGQGFFYSVLRAFKWYGQILALVGGHLPMGGIFSPGPLLAQQIRLGTQQKLDYSLDSLYRGTVFSYEVAIQAQKIPFSLDFNQAIFRLASHWKASHFQFPVFFRGTQFEGQAQFAGAQFEKEVVLSRACFRQSSDFAQTSWQGESSFWLARFEGLVSFQNAHFQAPALFGGVHFANTAIFSQIHFDSAAFFSGSNFQKQAVFEEAHFAGEADFTECRFAEAAIFSRAHFRKTAQWQGSTFGLCLDLRGAVFEESAWLDGIVLPDTLRLDNLEIHGQGLFLEDAILPSHRPACFLFLENAPLDKLYLDFSKFTLCFSAQMSSAQKVHLLKQILQKLDPALAPEAVRHLQNTLLEIETNPVRP
ncbi:MAG: hypothetical protein HC913_23285, partial [Microscillaceae bacterium]|nr:hypothetical protein [Microscillaceae bacterium]